MDEPTRTPAPDVAQPTAPPPTDSAPVTLKNPPPAPNAPAQSAAPPAPPAAAPALDPMVAAFARMNNAAGWFFWIAGFSVVNTVVAMFNGDWRFIIAPAGTMFLDVFAMDTKNMTARAVIFGISLLIAGVYLLFGVLARKGNKGAFITGLVIYALDTLLLFLDKALLIHLVFHAWAIFALVGGIKACGEYHKLKKAAAQQLSPTFIPTNLPPPPQYAPPQSQDTRPE